MPLASSTVPTTTVSQPPAAYRETSAYRPSVPCRTHHRRRRSQGKRGRPPRKRANRLACSSRKGAVATAGFFTRLSKKVATSF